MINTMASGVKLVISSVSYLLLFAHQLNGADHFFFEVLRAVTQNRKLELNIIPCSNPVIALILLWDMGPILRLVIISMFTCDSALEMTAGIFPLVLKLCISLKFLSNPTLHMHQNLLTFITS